LFHALSIETDYRCRNKSDRSTRLFHGVYVVGCS